MDFIELKPVIDLMVLQEERLAKKIEEVHNDVLDTRNELRKLNGTVRKHQEVLDKNIPHTIAHCPQKDTIEKIRDIVVGDIAIEKDKSKLVSDNKSKWTIRLMATGILVSILISIYNNRDAKGSAKTTIQQNDSIQIKQNLLNKELKQLILQVNKNTNKLETVIIN